MGAGGLALLGALAAPSGAQEPAAGPGDDDLRRMRALRLAAGETIRMDGALDEEAWERAEPATNFVQQEPVEGAEPSQVTEVRIVYDREALYIGALLRDTDPSGIVAHKRARDAGLGTDDRFMWILDTFQDGRSAYFFEINPAGLRGDGLLRTDVSFSLNKAWDGIWDAEVRRGPHGWSAEIRIPVRTLNFDPSLDAWGINFQRTVRRRNEEMLWEGHRRNEGLFRPMHAGLVTGLEGFSQGLGVEATPFVTGGWSHQPGIGEGDPSRTTTDAGFDVTYSVTPSLRASLTVNTDFAEVEVDQRRVNLTRFPLFFPEKRDFFLEGSDVFNFLPRNGVNPYFSRRIGLVEGEAVPIVAGGRLTGQTAGFDLGLVQVRSGAGAGLPGEDFTAARLKRNVLEESSVGVVYTRREPVDPVAPDAEDPQPRGQLLGFDVDLFTSRFREDRNLNFQAFFVFHTEPFPDRERTSLGDRSTRGIRLAYPNDIWNWHVSFREFGDRWTPQLGFAPRSGFRRLQPSLSWNPRPAAGGAVRQYGYELRYEYLTDLDGLLLTRQTGFEAGAELHSGDEVEVGVQEQYERAQEAFEIVEGVTIPPGGYAFTRASAGAQTARQRTLAGEVRVSAGEFWSGTRTAVEGSATVRPAPGVSLTADAEHNDVSLPGGDFTASVYRFQGEWHQSPDLSITSTLQYDDVSRGLGLFARLRWIVRPGSDVYLVYTQNWENPVARSLRTLERGGALKATYTHRF